MNGANPSTKGLIDYNCPHKKPIRQCLVQTRNINKNNLLLLLLLLNTIMANEKVTIIYLFFNHIIIIIPLRIIIVFDIIFVWSY